MEPQSSFAAVADITEYNESLRSTIAEAGAKGIPQGERTPDRIKAAAPSAASTGQWDDSAAKRYGLPDKASLDTMAAAGDDIPYRKTTPLTDEYYRAVAAGGGTIANIPYRKSAVWGKMSMFIPDFLDGVNRQLRGQPPSASWDGRQRWLLQDHTPNNRPMHAEYADTPDGALAQAVAASDRSATTVKGTFVAQTTMNVADIPFPTGWDLDNVPVGTYWNDTGVSLLRPKAAGPGAGTSPKQGEVVVDVVGMNNLDDRTTQPNAVVLNQDVFSKGTRGAASDAEYLLLPGPAMRYTIKSVTRDGEGHRMVVTAETATRAVKRPQFQDGAEALSVLNDTKNNIYDAIVTARAMSQLAVDTKSRDLWEGRLREVLKASKNLGGVDRLLPVPPSVRTHLDMTYPTLKPGKPDPSQPIPLADVGASPDAVDRDVPELLYRANSASYEDSLFRSLDAWIEGHSPNSTPPNPWSKAWNDDESNRAYTSITETIDGLIGQAPQGPARTISVRSEALGLSPEDWNRVRPGTEAGWTKQGFLSGASTEATGQARPGEFVELLVDAGTRVHEAPPRTVDLGGLLTSKALKAITATDLQSFNTDLLSQYGIHTEAHAKALFASVRGALKGRTNNRQELADSLLEPLGKYFQQGDIVSKATEPGYAVLPRGGTIVPLGISSNCPKHTQHLSLIHI